MEPEVTLFLLPGVYPRCSESDGASVGEVEMMCAFWTCVVLNAHETSMMRGEFGTWRSDLKEKEFLKVAS